MNAIRTRSLMILLAAALALSACEKKEEAAEQPQEAAQEQAEPAEKAEAPSPDAQAAEEEAGGQWVEEEQYKVKFRVPEDWKVDRGETSIVATSADQATTALLVGTESENMVQRALESVKEQVKLKDVILENSGATMVNGMPGYSAQGSAVVVQEEGDDQGIQFLMNAVKVDEKGAALMVFSEAEMYEAKKEEIDGIVKTLQRQ